LIYTPWGFYKYLIVINILLPSYLYPIFGWKLQSGKYWTLDSRNFEFISKTSGMTNMSTVTLPHDSKGDFQNKILKEITILVRGSEFL